jgi:hypothetical protein
VRQRVELVLGCRVEDGFLTRGGVVDLEEAWFLLVNGKIKADVGFAQIMHCKQVVGSLSQYQDVGNHTQMELAMVVLEQKWVIINDYLGPTDDAASNLSARD